MNPAAMKGLFSSSLLRAALCGSAFLAVTASTRAESAIPVRATVKAAAPKVTTETSRIGPATEQVVVTEKYRDGTVIRVVQIIHPDGSSETRGERSVAGAKT
jgi:hypothetical protein